MKQLSSALALVVALLVTAPASAVFVTVEHVNADPCDVLSVPSLVDELGLVGVFPDDEIIDVKDNFTDMIACPDSYMNLASRTRWSRSPT